MATFTLFFTKYLSLEFAPFLSNYANYLILDRYYLPMKHGNSSLLPFPNYFRTFSSMYCYFQHCRMLHFYICVDAKIPRGGSSRSTYARARKMYFALSYRTQSAHARCTRCASQFALQLTRKVNVKFQKLSVSQPISAARADQLSSSRFAGVGHAMPVMT